MVTTGGKGFTGLLGDLAVLRIGDLRSMEWEVTTERGTRPTPRKAHSMVSLVDVVVW